MSEPTPPVVLCIAGTDSGGAAGLAADLTTVAALGGHGAMVVTAVTAQDTTGVHGIHAVPLESVRAQVEAVMSDLPVAAIKTGMLGTLENALVVGDLLARLHDSGKTVAAVVDPVLVATSGAELATAAVVQAYREHVLPRAAVITPNRDEALALTGLPTITPSRELALALAQLGPHVVLTGGDPDAKTVTDILAVVDRHGSITVHENSFAAVSTTNDHGTGCTFAAALATLLAHGHPLTKAVAAAHEFVSAALRRSSTWQLGRGRGSLAHTIQPHASRQETDPASAHQRTDRLNHPMKERYS